MSVCYQFLFQKLHIGDNGFYFIIISNIQISKKNILNWKLHEITWIFKENKFASIHSFMSVNNLLILFIKSKWLDLVIIICKKKYFRYIIYDVRQVINVD
jgi:hypothetical protein